MRFPSRLYVSALSLTLLGLTNSPSARCQSPQPVAPAVSEKVDTAFASRLRDEEMTHGQVMQIASYLTDVIGSRLTGSPGQKHASEWTRDTFAKWGLSNAHLETWGPFGRGWSIEHFSAEVTSPTQYDLPAVPKAWSPGLSRPLDAEAVFLDAKTADDLAAYKGKLKGKIVLIAPLREIAAHFEPLGSRYKDEELAEMATAAAENGGGPGRRRQGQGGGPGRPGVGAFAQALQFQAAVSAFVKSEGAALIVDSSRGDGGTFFVQSASAMYGPETPRDSRHSVWENDAPRDIVPQIVVASEQYNRIVRTLQAGEPVRLHIELKTKEENADRDGRVANSIAEIPGTDKKDEIVMCGAHLDSWHGSTGATDNAAGSAVCMEAIRLLKTLGVTPRRTIRVALWTGEEQGLFGSQAYVKQHFGTQEMPKPEASKVSAYFNLDNGTGKVRGVFAQGNAAVMPIFAAWLQPFHDLGATTVTSRNTGSTDHVSFDRVGIPGFQFIQDTIEYGTRTHHSNQDAYDRLQPDDLKQASVLMAAFLYDAAMRDDPLPRKPALPAVAQTPGN